MAGQEGFFFANRCGSAKKRYTKNRKSTADVQEKRRQGKATLSPGEPVIRKERSRTKKLRVPIPGSGTPGDGGGAVGNGIGGVKVILPEGLKQGQ